MDRNLGDVQQLQKRSEGRVGPRLACSRQFAEDQAEIVRGGLYELVFADICQAPQPRAPPAAGVADVRKAPLAPFALQPFSAPGPVPSTQ